MRRTLAERTTAAEDDVREEALAQVKIYAVDGIDDHLVYTSVLLTNQFGIEQDLRCAETFGAELAEMSAECCLKMSVVLPG